jgi:hypothetical protein
MARRTKAQIEEDEQMTCSKRGCNKVQEEIFMFSSYHKAAVLEDVHELLFCEKHFKELEDKLDKKL